jgi:hypothetical protein
MKLMRKFLIGIQMQLKKNRLTSVFQILIGVHLKLGNKHSIVMGIVQTNTCCRPMDSLTKTIITII